MEVRVRRGVHDVLISAPPEKKKIKTIPPHQNPTKPTNQKNKNNTNITTKITKNLNMKM